MKRVLLLLCGLAAVQNLCARQGAGRFDLPYTSVRGLYVVTVETPAGAHRFAFDTGASRTVVSERLGRMLKAAATGRTEAFDYEGHRRTIPCIRIPRLRMGEALYTDIPADVLPDSSYIFSCLGLDGVVGSDLLRRFVVRMPNADSTITLADDIRTLGEPDRRRAVRCSFAGGCPLVVLRVRNGRSGMKIRAKFDTGSTALFDCRYDECRTMAAKGILRNVRRTVGHSGNLGWTNRSVVGEAMRGIAPALEIAGNDLGAVPVATTHGRHSILGCALFRWGRVVIDYPGRRFWLLPHADAPAPPDTSVRNIGAALDGGRLVVGQVWDESLAEIVSPGDRIVRIGTKEVPEGDPCAVVRGELYGDKPEMVVERRDGTRVTVPVRKL